MATKREVSEAPAPVRVTMLIPLNHTVPGRPVQPLQAGQELELERSIAARWTVMAWCAQPSGVTFTGEEIRAAIRWALEYHDAARRNSGSSHEQYWSIPANARALDRFDILAAGLIGGPQEAA